MKPDELLNELRDLEKRLYSAKLQHFFEQQSEDIRGQFVSLRQEVAVFVGKLTIDQLVSIADKFDKLYDDLNAGINNLQGEIDALNDTAEIMKTLDKMVRLATQIAVLSA